MAKINAVNHSKDSEFRQMQKKRTGLPQRLVAAWYGPLLGRDRWSRRQEIHHAQGASYLGVVLEELRKPRR